MTPDELHALGYSLEVSAWGLNVVYEPPETGAPIFTQVLFNEPLKYEEGCAIGWEAAQVDFVKRRLSA